MARPSRILPAPGVRRRARGGVSGIATMVTQAFGWDVSGLVIVAEQVAEFGGSERVLEPSSPAFPKPASWRRGSQRRRSPVPPAMIGSGGPACSAQPDVDAIISCRSTRVEWLRPTWEPLRWCSRWSTADGRWPPPFPRAHGTWPTARAFHAPSTATRKVRARLRSAGSPPPPRGGAGVAGPLPGAYAQAPLSDHQFGSLGPSVFKT